MRLLLSAYACEPDRGSESGIGWHWALEAARLGHTVWVVTRANNKPAIERAQPPLPNLRFVYYDLPNWMAHLKKKGPFLQLYYLLWQWGAFHTTRRLHQQDPFDVVQHITFGVFRHPSFMGRLGIPFIHGPIGGGERVPLRLRMDYGIRGHIADAMRDLANVLATWNPWLHETLTAAHLILVTTPSTGWALPSRYHYKVRVARAIGAPETGGDPPTAPSNRGFRFLFVGRFLFWKGVQYGLRAFARVLRDIPDARLTIVGTGPEGRRWRRLCQALNITDAVEWIGWVPQAELAALYRSHDAFLFPSLHDSSGAVLLEAMSHGLPVICFDLGGPGVLVTDRCGSVVPTAGKTRDELVADLAESMRVMATRSDRFRDWQHGALARARALTWAATIGELYDTEGLLQGQERLIGRPRHPAPMRTDWKGVSERHTQ